MIQEHNTPLRLSKAELLENTPIRQVCESDFPIYRPDGCAIRQSVCDLPEISLVVRGVGVHCIRDRAIPCKAGDLYLIAPDVPHGYAAIEEGEAPEVRRLFFDPTDWFDGATVTVGTPDYCYGAFCESPAMAYAMLTADTEYRLLSLMDAIKEESDSDFYAWRDAIRAHLSLLLITVARYVRHAIKTTDTLPQKEWSIVSSAVLSMTERFGEADLTLESVAEPLYVSPSHLSRLFKRMMGESFSDYLRALRLSHACALLESSTQTVEDIVKACGLRDVPSFYHAFHAHTGMTPNQYRVSKIKNTEHRKQGEKLMIILSEISENLQKGKAKIVKEMVQAAIDEGASPADILNEGLLSGMNVVGEKFKNNEIYVPEVLVAARAMNMGTQVLKPYLLASGVTATGKVCIGTVQGDLHDIGKNLVKMMLEGKGLEVVDLGVDVPAEKFVETAIAENCQIICCSALLTTTMSVMKDVVKAAEAAGVRDQIKIMVGGAPVNEEYCREIGADCYTPDAASAANAAAEFCKNA